MLGWSIFFGVLLGTLVWHFYVRMAPILPTSDPISYSLRNVTWQTDFSQNIPYSAGDELEYLFVLDPKNHPFSGVDISSLKNRLLISKITLDDKIVSETDLSKLSLSNATLLHIQ